MTWRSATWAPPVIFCSAALTFRIRPRRRTTAASAPARASQGSHAAAAGALDSPLGGHRACRRPPSVPRHVPARLRAGSRRGNPRRGRGGRGQSADRVWAPRLGAGSRGFAFAPLVDGSSGEYVDHIALSLLRGNLGDGGVVEAFAGDLSAAAGVKDGLLLIVVGGAVLRVPLRVVSLEVREEVAGQGAAAAEGALAFQGEAAAEAELVDQEEARSPCLRRRPSSQTRRRARSPSTARPQSQPTARPHERRTGPHSQTRRRPRSRSRRRACSPSTARLQERGKRSHSPSTAMPPSQATARLLVRGRRRRSPSTSRRRRPRSPCTSSPKEWTRRPPQQQAKSPSWSSS